MVCPVDITGLAVQMTSDQITGVAQEAVLKTVFAAIIGFLGALGFFKIGNIVVKSISSIVAVVGILGTLNYFNDFIGWSQCYIHP